MMGHRLMGLSLLLTGDIAEGRAHHDRAIALYNPAVHRALATRFAQDVRVAILSYRSWALWMLGYPEAALADVENAVKEARELGHPLTLIYALFHGSLTRMLCGNYPAAIAEAYESVALADEKGAVVFKGLAMLAHGSSLAVAGKATDAIQVITSGISALQTTGAAIWAPLSSSCLARAYAELGQFDEAWRCIGEAMARVETTKERRWEAEVNRTIGEIALISPEPDAAKAEAYFERALAIARAQQAKSWELRAAMSMARLWRDQGKRQQAHDLLAPVYGWFTEGFDTLDLKEAKLLLEQLKA